MSNVSAPSNPAALFTKHENTLKEATDAVFKRHFYAKYPEPPSGKIYGETANDDGMAAFKAQLGKKYEGLLQDADEWLESAEMSPYTMDGLGISYPMLKDPLKYVSLSQKASEGWRKLSPRERAGILTESLENIKDRFFELAYATMHSTGQGFMMAFQASGPHSNDRALEAIALGLHEQERFPEKVDWVKPMGKFDVKLKKKYKLVPMGVSLAIGCSTFPVWNTIPGIYASLVTGNSVICKPHPAAIYPMAVVVEELQKTLKAAGQDPLLVQLAVDHPDELITKKLAMDEAVRIIDYTGGNHFGDFIEGLKGKKTFTEKAGINSIVLHSTKDLKAMVQNISFSLSLYSGQMCTCPQNIYIPKEGITVDGEKVSYEETVQAIANAVKGLVTHEKMGWPTLGAIQSEATYNRVSEAKDLGYKVILDSIKVENPHFPKARIATPTLIEVPKDKREVFTQEMFGPIAFIIPVDGAEEGVRFAAEYSKRFGAITFAAYTTDEALQEQIIDEVSRSFTSIAFNFVGPIWVNQSAGFSDFHVTGGNPAGNASLTDPEYVLGRFEIVGIRIHE